MFTLATGDGYLYRVFFDDGFFSDDGDDQSQAEPIYKLLLSETGDRDSQMKIAVAQIRPSVGAIQNNIVRHEALIGLAVQHGASLLVFPELSLTGYESERAAEFACFADDSRIAGFQLQADQNRISIGVGVPLRTNGRPQISTVLFRPLQGSLIYSKRYLHADEELYFDRGLDDNTMIHSSPKIALAICYELSVPQHAQMAFDAGATVYVASVAKTESGMESASERLASIARDNSALVMMSNCLGVFDGAECVGYSAAWDRNGELIAQLDSQSEGVIVLDNDSDWVVTDTLNQTD